MSWTCPECFTKNDGFIIENERSSRCLCGYEPVSRKLSYKAEAGWTLFIWACPNDV
ncbi:MAG: hypothetical protein HY757_06435 [Nitrospirae bacterium]|nr:hypothetical protein [Nitrospirota bacterium]